MAYLHSNLLTSIAIATGTVGSVTSLLACLAYPLIQKLRGKQKELKRVSVTVDGQTIDAQVPSGEVEKFLHALRKYRSDDLVLGSRSRC